LPNPVPAKTAARDRTRSRRDRAAPCSTKIRQQKSGADEAAPDPRSTIMSPLLRRADLPNHARTRKLDERAITGCYELRVGVRLTKIPYRPVIDHVSATVGAELDVRRAVEPGAAADEGLFKLLVVGEPLDLQGQGLTASMIVIT